MHHYWCIWKGAQIVNAKKLLNAEQVRDEFRRHGKSISSWAEENGFSRATVNQVLTGRNAATIGVGHKIAVRMGIKNGVINDF